MSPTETIRVIDSHTEGEPTRVVVGGGPDLGRLTMAQARDRLEAEWDDYRRTVVCEPRGSDVLVGALLCEPASPDAVAGVVFFNNVGYLGMCGHGTMGVAVTLARLGRITPGTHVLETPVGHVTFTLEDDHRVTVRNVPGYRHLADVALDVPDVGRVTGDVAWGGNWFFLAHDTPYPLVSAQIGALKDAARKVRGELERRGITGAGGGVIDHIEFLGPAEDPGANARNFVLCPGYAYDRSPCGTGTSAKVACLAEDGRLQPGEVFRLESIIGSRFDATYQRDDQGRCVPLVTGRAFVTGTADLLLDPRDPFRLGIKP